MHIQFQSGGYTLAGNLFLPASNPKPLAFLLIQGWQGHQNVAAAKALAGKGYPAMTYDMRGHGDSQGDLALFSRADFIKDAVVAYDLLVGKVSAGTHIGVIGSSFGSYTAILLSKERDVYSLSLRVPAAYPDEGYDKPQAAQKEASGDFHAFRIRKVTFAQNRACQALHDFARPIRIIESGADEFVPHQVIENYLAAVQDKAKLTYQIMDDAPHSLETPEQRTAYEKTLLAWVATL